MRGGRPLAGLLGAVDADALEKGEAGDLRASLRIPAAAPVVGIVARVQAHRRFDLLLEAFEVLLRSQPEARLLVVGRGTRRAELLDEPVRRRGLADRVVAAGYRTDDYAAVLRSMDVFTYLVPGSDGTCRALLEAGALALPAVVSRRGALAEIVEDERSGLVVDEAPEALRTVGEGRALGKLVIAMPEG